MPEDTPLFGGSKRKVLGEPPVSPMNKTDGFWMSEVKRKEK